MDSSKYMIIDTSKYGRQGMFITRKVMSIYFKDFMWNIVFTGSDKVYTYRKERIMFIKNPTEVDLEHKGVYMGNKALTNIGRILRFEKDCSVFYHVFYESGWETDYTEREIYITRTSLDECGGDTLNYLVKLAEETGIVTDTGVNVLKAQYARIDRKRDDVPLAQYLGLKEKMAVYECPPTVVYPFSCNVSQMKGVVNALTNQLSIIQGPPGTGKTQTILNIIANILMMGKTVMVVSNNNSAVENVAEKLSSEKIGLGFLIAKLGRQENKETFIANQPPLPDIKEWVLDDAAAVESEINDIQKLIAEGLEVQNRLAGLCRELQEHNTEEEYDGRDFSMILMLPQKIVLRGGSKKIVSLKCDIDRLVEKGGRMGLLFKIKWMLRIGFDIRKILRHRPDIAIRMLEDRFYVKRRKELENEIQKCRAYLASVSLKDKLERLSDLSLRLVKHYIAISRKSSEREVFKYPDLKCRCNKFPDEYPIVLSTTYSCKGCISKDMVFDYIIMDEASQVDIATGALALSCARNAVIVGDDKQLPNVIDGKMMKALNVIENLYHVEDVYRSSTHSFLESCCGIFTSAPQTLLREHYRCHPKIIEFCNKMFYDGELITMTRDGDERDVLRVIRTPKGQHARGHYNQREIDVIEKEIMPSLTDSGSVGVISPYRNQAECINHQLDCDIASTVHKYQGRECDTIIMSMVDNGVTDFSDDANLLNVAISRAKSKLCVVVTGNDIPSESVIGQLVSYVRYNNFEVTESRVHSVFDILYGQYTAERLAFERNMKGDVGELSENIIYDMLLKCIKIKDLRGIDVLCHYPMFRLVSEYADLSEEERGFVNHEHSHIDFLLYNKVTKVPKLCIEVDGWAFHNTDVQRKRDALKDAVLDKCNIHHVRLSTTATVTEDSIMQLLSVDFMNQAI